MKGFLLVCAAAALIPGAVLAYVSPGAPRGFVNDFAGMLAPADVEGLEAKLATFERNTGDELAVVTVPTLGGDTVENFTVKLFEEWKIGKEGKDNGILLLVARDEREVRIEVGYGLEGFLTDAQSHWIIERVVVPAFREGKFSLGLDGAVDRIIAAIGGETIPSLAGTPMSALPKMNIDWFWLALFLPVWLGSVLARSKSWWAGGVVGGAIGIILGFVYSFLYTGLVAVVVLTPLGLLFDYVVSKNYGKFRSQGRTPPWWIGGGGFGGGHRGGFGGFGGGMSGGGGASGKW